MNNAQAHIEFDKSVFDFNISTFESRALEIFRFQYTNNPVYRLYADSLNKTPDIIGNISEIPFLPIQFFKSQSIRTTSFEPEATFESSGTTQTINSRHYIKDLSIYTQSFLTAFGEFYGSLEDWCILGLLPSYLERKNSSLVYMVDELIRKSRHPKSGFYLYDYPQLHSVLKLLESQNQKTLLIGVTFALLDFAEQFPLPLKNTVVMETGGMKGRKQELTRMEVHEFLKKQFDLSSIHSEYGMTELLSQAYSSGNGIFKCPPWMRVLIRDEEDPLSVKSFNSSDSWEGIINVIDLANIYSCSFIATDDIGKLYRDGSFEVLGRMDNSDLRGCSLLIVES